MEDRELRTLNHLMFMEYYTGGNAGLFMKMKRLVYSYHWWWHYTPVRKHTIGRFAALVAKWKQPAVCPP